jgi:hypothetical protein
MLTLYVVVQNEKESIAQRIARLNCKVKGKASSSKKRKEEESEAVESSPVKPLTVGGNTKPSQSFGLQTAPQVAPKKPRPAGKVPTARSIQPSSHRRPLT